MAILVDVRLSMPAPGLSAVGSDPLKVVLLTIIELLPAFRLLIPVELNAVVTSAAAPEIEPTDVALMVPVVMASRELRADAVAEVSVTVNA